MRWLCGVDRQEGVVDAVAERVSLWEAQRAAVGVGAGVGVGIYLIHRSHTSLTGCVQQTDNGLSLTAKDGNTYELVNAPSEVKARTRLSLRGHKIRATSGRAFRVDHLPETAAHAVPESQCDILFRP